MQTMQWILVKADDFKLLCYTFTSSLVVALIAIALAP
jgi:hypothetical protein